MFKSIQAFTMMPAAMYIVVVLCVVMGTVTSTDPTFEPGCSFYGGKCIYSIKLGHKEQCDTPQNTATSSGGGGTGLRQVKDDLDKLKTQMDVMSTMITDTSKSKSNLEKELKKALAARDDILAVLKRTESDVNSTNDDLAKLTAKAAKEIQNLRDELTTCQSALTGETVTNSDKHTDFLSHDYSLVYYNFDGKAGGFALSTRPGYGITLLTKGSSTSTGPRADHTLGVSKGSYLGIDSRAIGDRKYNDKTLTSYQTVGDVFPVANAYCVMFWYYMRGNDVQALSTNIKINGGVGYPVFSKKGHQSYEWELAQIDLSNEYTQHPFQIIFKMTSFSFEHYFGGKNVIGNPNGDIAVDDLYVYNTTCSNIPRYRGTHSFYNDNVTSFYTFHFTPMTWTEAYDVCRREGPWSALVSVETAAEQTALVNIIRSNSAYSIIGAKGFYTSGSDNDNEHSFSWTNTGVRRALKFTHWQMGQPNNVAGNQDCLLMEYPNDDFRWGDVNCDTKHPFICEVEVSGKVTE